MSSFLRNPIDFSLFGMKFVQFEKWNLLLQLPPNKILYFSLYLYLAPPPS